MRSDMPEAERFQDWVCEEVLPSIREHGAYMTLDTLEQSFEDPNFLIALVEKLKKAQDE